MGKYENKGKYKATNDINITVGSRIMEIRKKHGWSQEDFARKVSTEQIDFTSSKISKIESGQQPLTIAELCLIAERLEVNILYFFGKTESMSDDQTYLYEVASKLTRLERAGEFIDCSEYIQYEPEDIFLSIDMKYENYLLTGKTLKNENANNENCEMRKYVIYPYGKFIISGTEDGTANKEIKSHLQESYDLLEKLKNI